MRISFLLNLIRSTISYWIIYSCFLIIVLLAIPLHFINPYLSQYFVFIFGTEVTVGLCRLIGLPINIEHLKSDKPMLVVSNHSHEFDTLILSTALDIPSYIAKKSLKIFLAFDHFVFLDRNGRDLDFVKQAQDRINKGMSVVIFPEGTRVKPGDKKPYSKSVALLARRLDVPVVLYAMNVGKVMQKYKGFTTIAYNKMVYVKKVEIVTYGEVLFKELYGDKSVNADTRAFKLSELNQALAFLSKKDKVYEYLHNIASPWSLGKDLEASDLDSFLEKSAPFEGIDTREVKSEIIKSIAVVKHINTMSNAEKDTLFTEYAENTIRAAVDKLA